MVEETKTTFKHWCVVELMGHQQIAGLVTEETIFGTAMMRVDVPKTSKRDGFTRFYGPGAIYAMTPVDEKIAALMAEKLEIEPVSEWTLQRAMQKLLPNASTAPHPDLEDWDSSSEWPDDDEYRDEPAELRRVSIPEDAPFFGDMPDDIGEPDRAKDKREAAQWARDLLQGEFVIVDTETTGIGADDEIIQIGIIDQAGNAVLEQLIKPTSPITNTAHHGLTDDSVKDAPGFSEVYERIKVALKDKIVVAYNYSFDRGMLVQVCYQHGLAEIVPLAHHCVMEQYAQFHGEWNDYHGNYRWKKLREALAAFGLKHEDFGTKEHDACTDARATLAVIKKMAEFEAETSAATEMPS